VRCGGKSLVTELTLSDELLAELRHHFGNEGGKGELRVPVPIAASSAVVEGCGPTGGNSLAHCVGVVLNVELGNVLLHLGRELEGGEVAAADIVHATSEARTVNGKELNGGVEAVVNHHHGKTAVLAKEAGELVRRKEPLIENINGVVGRPTARGGGPGDNTRVAKAAEINTPALEVIRSQKFSPAFANAIESSGVLNCIVGSVVTGGVRAESGNARWAQDTKLMVLRDLKNIGHTLAVDIKALQGILLANNREKSSVVDNPCDAMVNNELLKLSTVGYITMNEGLIGFIRAHPDIRANDVLTAVSLTEGRKKLGTNLSESTSDEDTR